MNVSGITTQEVPEQRVTDKVEATLSGRWLSFLRPACIVVIAVALALWIVAIPIRYAQLATVCSAVCGDQQISQRTIAHFRASGLTTGFYSAYVGTLEVFFVLTFVVIALIILWKKSTTRIGLITALFLITFGVTNTDADVLTSAYPVLSLPVILLQLISWSSLGVFLFVFPDGRFTSTWMRLLALVSIALLLLSNAPLVPPQLFLPCLLSFVLLTFFTQIYRYRYVSTPTQRQQTKWVILGTTTAIAGILGLSMLANVLPQYHNAYFALLDNTLWYLFELLIPLSIGFAIARSKLWDIDVVINRALVYGSLTIILALIYSGLVIGLQFLVGNFTGEEQSPLIIVGTTLFIAALFQPLRHRLQRLIDHRFYRRKYDATQTLATFSATLRNEVDLNQLTAQLLEVVEETMQPAHVSLWMRLPLSQTRFGEEGGGFVTVE